MLRSRASRWLVAGIAACLIALGIGVYANREVLLTPHTYEGRIKAYFRLLDEAEKYEQRGDIDRALSRYERAVALAPSYLHPPALYSRALLLLDQRRHKEAISDLDRAIDIDGSDDLGFRSRLFGLRAQSHAADCNWDLAVADADEAIRLDATASTYQAKCLILYEAGRADEALRIAEDALAGMPDNLLLLHTRGMFQWFRNHFPAARSSFEQAVAAARAQKVNDWTRAWIDSTLAAYLSTCVEEAQRDGTRAVALATEACHLSNWKDADHLESLACAHAELGQFEKAVEFQQQAVQASDAPQRNQRSAVLQLFRNKTPFRERHPRLTLPGG